jgi:hypothetical protein
MPKLSPERLELSVGHSALDSALGSGQIQALCPCDAVVNFKVPQATAYARLQAVNGEWGEYGRRSIAEILEETGVAPELDTAQQGSSTDAVVFYRRLALKSSSDIAKQGAIGRFVEIGRTSAKLFPGYKVGPSLRSQEGAEPLLRALQEAFLSLWAAGLVDNGFLGERFAHSSVMLLASSALGAGVSRLIPFFVDPFGFLGSAISRSTSLDVEPDECAAQLRGRALRSTELSVPEQWLEISTSGDHLLFDQERADEIATYIGDRKPLMRGRSRALSGKASWARNLRGRASARERSPHQNSVR